MLKKFFSALGFLSSLKHKGDPAKEGYSPYDSAQNNLIYNSLFCDKLEVLRRFHEADINANAQDGWAIVLATAPEAVALKRVAEDQAQDSRLRATAYLRLRELGQLVTPKQLFGVIIELGMAKGLDTLAAYPDGELRYFNHTGKTSTYEAAAHGWMPKVYSLLSAGQSAVDLIGPWDQMRLAPPANGHVRMTFLVSDGLYFGEGPVQVMQQDEMAKPIIAAGLELLKVIVAQSEKDEAAHSS